MFLDLHMCMRAEQAQNNMVWASCWLATEIASAFIFSWISFSKGYCFCVKSCLETANMSLTTL